LAQWNETVEENVFAFPEVFDQVCDPFQGVSRKDTLNVTDISTSNGAVQRCLLTLHYVVNGFDRRDLSII
jgi:hypothetical protein